MPSSWDRAALSGVCVLGEELPGPVARHSSLDRADGGLLLLLVDGSVLTAAECHAHEDARNWAGQGVPVAIQVGLMHELMAQHPQQKHTAGPVGSAWDTREMLGRFGRGRKAKAKGPKGHARLGGRVDGDATGFSGRAPGGQAAREELLARVAPARTVLLPWVVPATVTSPTREGSCRWYRGTTGNHRW